MVIPHTIPQIQIEKQIHQWELSPKKRSSYLCHLSLKSNVVGTNIRDAKYLTLVETEVNRIVNSILIKLWNDIAELSGSNGKELGAITIPHENDDDLLASWTHHLPRTLQWHRLFVVSLEQDRCIPHNILTTAINWVFLNISLWTMSIFIYLKYIPGLFKQYITHF